MAIDVSGLFTGNSAKSTSTHGGTSRTIPTPSTHGGTSRSFATTNATDALIDTLNSYIVSTANANAMNAQAAMYATQASMQEAQRNREFQWQSLQQQMAYNSAEAEANRAWQTQMSNTSYQRAMADMKAAGLNPILAYSQGGAANGSGAQASIGTLSGAMGSAYSWDNAQSGQSMQMIGLMVAASMTAISSVLNKLTDNGESTAKKALSKWIKKKTADKVNNFTHYGNSSAK